MNYIEPPLGLFDGATQTVEIYKQVDFLTIPTAYHVVMCLPPLLLLRSSYGTVAPLSAASSPPPLLLL